MFAATIYKLLKLMIEPSSRQLLIDNLGVLVIGNVVAFIVAIVAIKFFIDFLTKYGFKAFGYYRIIVGVAILIMILCGVDMHVG